MYKVLIVEDDPMVAMINEQYILKNKDFCVCGTCKNGVEALDFLRKTLVDLVLLDVYMPLMNGRDSCVFHTQSVVFISGCCQPRRANIVMSVVT